MNGPTYWLIDPQTDVYVGDCREVMPNLEPGRVDLVFADPPFNWNVNYGDWDDSLPRQDYIDFTHDWLDECVRLLKPNGSLWVNIPDDTAAEIVMYLKTAGLHMVNWCIWHYRFGQCIKSKFIASKVHALYFAMDKNNRTWNADAILEPSDRATTYGDKRTQTSATPGLRVPFDVWQGPGFCRVQGNNKERRPLHQNQLPEAYLERVIKACSNSGDIVLDPFLGSGTTAVVARALNRRPVGIEYSETLAASAFERIKGGAVRISA